MSTQENVRAGITIMVVDDEPMVCQILERILGEEGYRVVTAASGRDAVAIASQGAPHLILLDIVMPEMDGIETLHELRRQGYRGVVIMLTGRGTLQTAREAMLLGAFDYITKPFDVDFLKAVLREGLKDRLQGESACVR
jgi:DNA-binding response OmpR family regulator